MDERLLGFLDIPERGAKPRTRGLTLARDYGIGYRQAEDWMEAAGAFVDYVKMRHLFTLLMGVGGDDPTRRKVALYRAHGAEVNPGGIVFEIAFAQGKVERTFEALAGAGFSAVECSENIVRLTRAQKLAAIEAARARGLEVLFEIGEKYPEGPLDVDRAVADIEPMLERGCRLVIVERSLIERSLGERGEGAEAGRLEALAARVPLERLVWEAEAVPHQVWLIRTFGPEVNLGPNLEPEYVNRLEATRRTLSREGGYGWLKARAGTG